MEDMKGLSQKSKIKYNIWENYIFTL